VQVALQQLVNGLTVGAFYALIALGYTMVYGIIRLINFAQGDLYAVGAFIGLSMLSTLAAVSVRTPALTVALALIVSMGFTGGLGVVIYRTAYRPLLRNTLSILISAIGASLTLEYGLFLVFSPSFLVYPHLFGFAGPSLGGVIVTWTQVGIFGVSLLLMSALYALVHGTKLGLAMRALAINQDAARLMGIDVDRVIGLTFFIGSALAAFGGMMTGLYYGQISFLMGFLAGLKAFTAAVLGGIGNIPGAVLGGFVVGIVESLATGYVSGRWKDVITFAILILILVVRPRGLLGERVVERM
jgi:branched-chain amino acid transport system permease protein